MNREQYLKLKEARKAQLPKIRPKCTKCWRPKDVCFCDNYQAFETRTQIILLMHPKEAKKERTGTGRMTSSLLKNSKIIIDVDFTNNRELNLLLADETREHRLLYPGENSHNITVSDLPAAHQKPLSLYIIDGTWACAKTMMRESKNLHHLPRLSFTTEKTSLFDIKHQPEEYCLSTIESAFYTLQSLKKWGHEAQTTDKQLEQLLDSLRDLVAYQRACASDPNREGYRRTHAYKKPEERKKSIKWEQRKVCFEKENYD